MDKMSKKHIPVIKWSVFKSTAVTSQYLKGGKKRLIRPDIAFIRRIKKPASIVGAVKTPPLWADAALDMR